MDKGLVPGVPTAFIDHHRPFGHLPGTLVLSSYGQEPSFPTSFLTYQMLSRLTPLEDLGWLAVVGSAGDLGSDFVSEHFRQWMGRLKKKDVTDAEVLINSARRSSRYDLETPLRLLSSARELSQLVDRQSEDVRRLESYRKEVNREVKRCRHEQPHFRWRVAVIPFRSRCEIQGLLAETWRRQLKNYLVIAANFGYIENKVAYAIRTELDSSVIDFMESLKPAGHGWPVAFGHDRAAGAILDQELWLRLIERMGFKSKPQEHQS
jgi:single-stranded-DNA-specific exonuclease